MEPVAFLPRIALSCGAIISATTIDGDYRPYENVLPGLLLREDAAHFHEERQSSDT